MWWSWYSTWLRAACLSRAAASPQVEGLLLALLQHPLDSLRLRRKALVRRLAVRRVEVARVHHTWGCFKGGIADERYLL